MSDGHISFSKQALNRAGHLRKDPAWQESALRNADAQILLMRDGRPLCSERSEGLEATWMGPQVLGLLDKTARPLFLGLDKKDRPYFAVEPGGNFDLDGSPLAGIGAFEDARQAAGRLDEFDLNLMGTARSVFDWHERHGFCAKCGTRTDIVEAGWRRDCPGCGAEHYPRVDPVAIMLAVCGDHCLVAEGLGFPAGMVSCLAGYIEPGETFEDGARRELLEEAGVLGGEVRYVYGQPWPFPSSLMLGMIIECEEMTLEIDKNEINDASWITKAEAADLLRGEHDRYWCPPPFAIAHQILKTWVEGEPVG